MKLSQISSTQRLLLGFGVLGVCVAIAVAGSPGPKQSDSDRIGGELAEKIGNPSEFEKIRARTTEVKSVSDPLKKALAAAPEGSPTPTVSLTPEGVPERPTGALPDTPTTSAPTSVGMAAPEAPPCDKISKALGRCGPIGDPSKAPSTEADTGLSKSGFTRLVGTEHLNTRFENTSETTAPLPTVEKDTGTGLNGSRLDPQLAAARAVQRTELQTLSGPERQVASHLIQSSCRIIAVIEDELVVRQGEKARTTLRLHGVLPGCAWFPESLRMLAEFQMNTSGSVIQVSTKTCSIPGGSVKSFECPGDVKSITGAPGLEGFIYDMTMWKTVLRYATNILSLYSLESLAQSSTLVTGSNAEKFANAFTEASKKLAEDVAAGFGGREIRLPPRAVVIVTFTQDIPVL